jgi:hypothetical protein
MALEPGQEALVVFTASGEAILWLESQRWQVTYFVLLAYAALAAAPQLICKNAANGVRVLVNWSCVGFVCAIAGLASWHLWNLQEEHSDQFKILYDAARRELPLVLDLHGWKEAPEPGRLVWGLVAAVWIGALLVIGISLSRR